jgi:hypothetical protein
MAAPTPGHIARCNAWSHRQYRIQLLFVEEKTLQPLKMLAPALAIALAACGGPHADANNASAGAKPDKPSAAPPDQHQSAPPVTTQGNAPMHEVDSFVPAGMKVVETIRGDLTGAGHSDALIVVSPPPAGNEKLGEGAPRTVILLIQDASGALHKSAENARIVPCARCGGLAGDPYAYSRIEKGQFTISVSGGSRERWGDDFTFRYAADRKTWLLDKVVRELTDTQTEQHKALELAPRDFGPVPFADFDPANLPKVEPLQEKDEVETN